MSSCASVTFPAPAPSTCAPCHSLRHHCHHPQLQPFTGSFAESERISCSPYDLSTPRTRSVVPALEATLDWERFTPPDEVSALGHPLFPAEPTANTAEPQLNSGALSGDPSGSPPCPALHCPLQDTQPLHTRSMRGAFCFRLRRLCRLMRREALLCSVELLNLEEKARESALLLREWWLLTAGEPQKWYIE